MHFTALFEPFTRLCTSVDSFKVKEPAGAVASVCHHIFHPRVSLFPVVSDKRLTVRILYNRLWDISE
jgi:hypothetical protein